MKIDKEAKTRKKVAEFINKIPWIINCNAEFYWEQQLSKGIRSNCALGTGFSMSESMISWIFGYAEGIYDWEMNK
jgi:hypothetical protein